MNVAKKPRKYGFKFWLVFWFAAGLALLGWHVFLQVRNRNIENLKPLAKILPVSSERKKELQVLADIYQKMGGHDREKTFLVLFQNDMELRPGGGFIGSFGILKAKNGKVSDIEVEDTGVFDQKIPDTQAPPAPIEDVFGVKGWKMRDSNWSPDFPENARKAAELYRLGSGPAHNPTERDSEADREIFDGVIAVNTNVLNSVLSVTGPVKINDYPGLFNDETAVLQLEYQVEKGYLQQGIEKGKRKSIMKEMAEVLVEKAHNFSFREQLELAGKIEEHLKRKDIQIFFSDGDLQKEIDEVGWSGRVKDFSGDYLMLVDANLNSLKSDVCIRRKIEYAVDLSSDQPAAFLNITYEHTCRARDWMTTNYNSWTRLYVPSGAYLTQVSGIEGDVEFGEELGKKVFGFNVFVPIGETKTVALQYNLPAASKSDEGEPQNISPEDYKLLIQKQSGSGYLPVKITVKKPDRSEKTAEETLTGDRIFEF